MLKVEVHQHGLDGFCTNAGGESVFAIFVLRVEQFVFAQQLELLKRGQARLGNDVVFEIQHALKLLQLHIQQQADARRQRLQEPDMRNRGSELDVAHALTAHLGNGDFNAALFTDDALILHALILTAKAFIVLHGSEDTCAEKAVTLWLERTVVDGFGLFDFTKRPAADFFRRCDPDLDLVKCFDLGDGIVEFAQFVHNLFLIGLLPMKT